MGPAGPAVDAVGWAVGPRQCQDSLLRQPSGDAESVFDLDVPGESEFGSAGNDVLGVEADEME